MYGMYDSEFNLVNEVKYFPSFEDGVFCFSGGLGPETRLRLPHADPYQWSSDTLLDCCRQNFQYDMDACMNSGGYASPSGLTGACPIGRTGELEVCL